MHMTNDRVARKQWFVSATWCIATLLALTCLLPIVRTARGDDAAEQPFSIVDEREGTINEFVMHVPAGQLDDLLPTLGTLLPQLAPTTEGFLICGDLDDAVRLRHLINAWHLQHPERFRVRIWSEVETIWSRDRYVALRDRRNRTLLLHPPSQWGVDGDFAVPKLLGLELPSLIVAPASLDVEGGDLLAGPRRLLVGGTVVRAARQLHGLADEEDLRRRLEAQFGKTVMFIPAFDTVEEMAGDLDFHLDMFLTLTGENSVLLADPDWGDRLAVQMAAEGFELPPPTDDAAEQTTPPATTRRRIELVRNQLQRAGVRIDRVPLYLVPGEGYSVSYNNVLQEETPSGFVVYLPYYGAGPLDAAAADVYSQLGYQIRPVDVRGVFQGQGALRCVVNVIGRQSITPAVPVDLNASPSLSPAISAR